jgi:hypothetical protein
MRAAQIRTHFDRFSPIECAVLAYLGYYWANRWVATEYSGRKDPHAVPLRGMEKLENSEAESDERQRCADDRHQRPIFSQSRAMKRHAGSARRKFGIDVDFEVRRCHRSLPGRVGGSAEPSRAIRSLCHAAFK